MDINEVELVIAFYAFLIMANTLFAVGSAFGFVWAGLAAVVWIMRLHNRKIKRKE